MSILRDIQAALLSAEADLGTILLKLRFLANRLGSVPLEDWVKHEAEGYPPGFEVPDYRKVGVTYRGTWSGPFGSGIQNAPIPDALIRKFANESWCRYNVRESIASVDQMAKKDNLGINASNLILLLQGNVYEDWACQSITGTLSPVAMMEIRQAVRSRILELTLELEKQLPEAAEVTIQQNMPQKTESQAMVTQIFNQTVYGGFNNVTATDNSQITLSIASGDTASMVRELVRVGIPEPEANEFAQIVAEEKPASAGLGQRALTWIASSASKAAAGAWGIGTGVVGTVLTEAALKYYDLK